MELTESSERIRSACDEARVGGASVGFVPTMGDLHAGHEGLIRTARGECDVVVVSIFVNPLQFDSPADLEAYPRTLERDRSVAGSMGVDLIFAPAEDEIYPAGRPEVTIHPGPLGQRLEGASRSGHFAGVLTVVAKLFHLVGPARAYFGQKDAQQLALVRRMVLDLEFPITVVACATVREADGLAISSRNSRLSTDERRAAPVLFEALSDAAVLARQGERRADLLRAEMARRIGAESLAQLDYVAIVEEDTWEDVDDLARPARALVAARFADTRLIDNLALPVGDRRSVHNSAGPEET